MKFEIEKDFRFDAAHYFTHDNANDIFKRMHGHSFSGTIRIEGDTQESKGWIRDLWKIETLLQDTIKPLDHVVLNDVDGLDAPSLENIAEWIFSRLAPKLPGLIMVEVGRPSYGERARIKAS